MKNSSLRTLLLAVALIWATTLTTQAGWIKRYLYADMSGTSVTNLLYGTNSSGVLIFPDTPSETQLIPPSYSDQYYFAESLSGYSDNYGSYLPGYIEPPETGTYTFWVCGDDQTQLWLTSDPADSLNPAKKQMIAEVSGWSNARDWVKYPEQKSAEIYLEKGKQYYMEILHKEGTGGDNVGWGWQLPSGIFERPMRTFYLQPTQNTSDPVAVNGPFAAPFTAKNESDMSIYDGMDAMLWVDLNLTPPYTVAWQKNGVDIPGANQTYYRFKARTSDSGAQFHARVNGVLYGPLSLTVYGDTIAPELVSATLAANNPTQISLVFSEAITPASATATLNYTLNTGAVLGAQLLADGVQGSVDGRVVLLKTSLLAPGQLHTLTIRNIQDLALPANTMPVTTTNFLVTDSAVSFRIWYSSYATDLATLRTWSGPSSTAPTYVNNEFNEERTITTTSYQWSLLPLRNTYMGQMIGYLTAPETGNYKFAIASDDHSILYLGTTDERSSKREICYYNGSTGRWNVGAQLANQQSALIPLEAGKRYYFEAVYRDGTGGDGVSVFWQTPSGATLPTANESVQANTEPFLIPARYLSVFGGSGNVVLLTDLPSTFSAAESTRPTLSVVADGTRPFAYQWFKNGEVIPGAAAANYTLPYVRATDNNATYAVVVTNNFSSVTSVVATLTVTADAGKTTVASVGSLYKQVIEVQLSEAVTEATATDTANYLVLSSAGAPVAVTAAIQSAADPAHITLQTEPLPETDLMQLVVKNLVDLSAAANVMDPQTNSFRANNFDTLTRINNTQAFSAVAVGDQITMTAGGSDIWGTADQLAYLHKTVTGNFDYKVRGVSLPAVNGWTKMGPMARASTASNARNAIACWTPLTPAQNQYSPQMRDTTGGNSSSSADANAPLQLGLQGGVVARPTVSYPSWLRLQRVGSSIYYYYSANGTNWTFWTWFDSANSTEGPLPATLQMGLALTSHDTARTVHGVMSSFSIVDDGVLRFTLTPTNAIVAEGATAFFASAVAGHSPWFFQWSKNGTPIPNATNATLTLTAVPFTDNNSTINLTVTNPYGESVSANVTLTVLEPDRTKPSVASVGSLYGNTVELYFTENVTSASAVNTANYSLRSSSGSLIGIQYVSQDPENPAHVTLTTAPMPDTDLMRLACSGIVDMSVAANVMDLQTNVFRANNFEGLERLGNTQDYSARAEGDQIFMTAGGSDIWGTADQCAFLWKMVSGNFDYKVQGVSLPLVNSWCKMGPMLRTSPTGVNDRNNFACFTPVGGQNTYSAQVRTNAGVATSSTGAGEHLLLNLQTGVTARPAVVYPSWLRLQRIGDQIYYYYSTTGTNWTFWTWYDSATSTEGPLPNDVYLGLALTSHDTAQTVNGVMASWSKVEEGPLNFLVEPVSTSVQEGGNVTFTSVVAGRGPYFRQWTKNGADIPNATGANLALANIPLTDNGALYSIRVTNPYGDAITSSNAVLTVIQDTFKPVPYAVGSLRGTGVGVYFNDLNRLDPVSASDPANYSVNGGAVNVTGATLEPDNLAVMLTLSAPISGDFSVTISNVKDAAPTTPNTMDTVTLQGTVVTWPMNQDVGTLNATPPPTFTNPVMPGFAQAIGTDGFYVHAGGADIWGAADGMHFMHRAITGNFDVAAQVTGLRQADVWTKAGLMVRVDLDADSRNYMLLTTPPTGQNQMNMQWRLTKGAAASYSLADGVRPRSSIPNAWMRATREDQVFTFYWSTNGSDWVTLYTTNEVATPYPETVYVGLAATSHNNGTALANTTGAYFRNVTGLMAPPAAPTIQVAVQGSTLVLTWTTTDAAFKLQSSVAINTGWADDPAAVVIAGDTRTVTVPLGTGAKFYRLIKP